MGVNVGMAHLAGEVFDGFHVHPFHSPRYLDERIRPAIAESAAAAGRSAADVEIICPVFTIVGDDESARAADRESVRRQLAFYGSTRTYRPVFELHGWADASDELHRLMAARTAAMAAVITDEMLDEYAVTSTWDELADRLLDRYRGRADRIFSYHPGQLAGSPETTERWRAVAARSGQPDASSFSTSTSTVSAPKEVGIPRGQGARLVGERRSRRSPPR